MEENRIIAGMMFRCKADAALTIIHADEGAHTVCGYTPAELVDTGYITLPDLIHLEDRDTFRRAIQEGLTKKRSFVIWTRLQIKDKTPAEGIIIGSGAFCGPLSLSGIDGYIIRILASPARIRAGDILSPEICLQLLTYTEEIIVLLTEDGIMSYVTPSISKIIGRTQAAVTGLPFSQLLLPGEQKRFDEFRTEVPGGESSTRFGITLPDGESCQISVRSCKPGGVAGVILIINRIDETNETVIAKDTLYHDLFIQLPVPAIITTATDLRIQKMNHAATTYALSLSPAGHASGADLRETGIISSETIDQIRDELEITGQVEHVESGSGEKNIVVTARKVKNGEQDLIIWILTEQGCR